MACPARLSNSADRRAAFSASERDSEERSTGSEMEDGSQPGKSRDFGTATLGVRKKSSGEAKGSKAYAGLANR